MAGMCCFVAAKTPAFGHANCTFTRGFLLEEKVNVIFF